MIYFDTILPNILSNLQKVLVSLHYSLKSYMIAYFFPRNDKFNVINPVELIFELIINV